MKVYNYISHPLVGITTDPTEAKRIEEERKRGTIAMAADYQLATADENGPVIRNEDGAWIPDDPGNADFQKYLAWCEAGGVPDPYVPPPEPEPAPPPTELTDTMLYAHENRIRALEGRPPLTLDEFKASG